MMFTNFPLFTLQHLAKVVTLHPLPWVAVPAEDAEGSMVIVTDGNGVRVMSTRVSTQLLHAFITTTLTSMADVIGRLEGVLFSDLNSLQEILSATQDGPEINLTKGKVEFHAVAEDGAPVLFLTAKAGNESVNLVKFKLSREVAEKANGVIGTLLENEWSEDNLNKSIKPEVKGKSNAITISP